MVILGFILFLIGFALVFLLMYLNLSILGFLVGMVGMLLIQREIIKNEGVISFWKSKHTIGFITSFIGFAIMDLSHFTNSYDAERQLTIVGLMLFIFGFVVMSHYMYGKGFMNDHVKYLKSLKTKQPWEK